MATHRGTYRYTECLNCPDGQIEWTRSGSWYHADAIYYPNDLASPEEGGYDDDTPEDVLWCPDEGANRKVSEMPPAFQVLVMGWIENYQWVYGPDDHCEPHDRYDRCA